jgi:hypothetical protein
MCRSRVRLIAPLAFAVAVALCGPQQIARAADIPIVLDQARLVKLPDRAATVVIGNPAIADASVQAGGWMVITGKGYGRTNIIALDRSGVVLMENSVQVQPAQDVVVVYKGVDRETYSCAPMCDRRLTLGDGHTFFESTAAQIIARNALATATTQSR